MGTEFDDLEWLQQFHYHNEILTAYIDGVCTSISNQDNVSLKLFAEKISEEIDFAIEENNKIDVSKKYKEVIGEHLAGLQAASAAMEHFRIYAIDAIEGRKNDDTLIKATNFLTQSKEHDIKFNEMVMNLRG
jgi:hypothetical protein